MLVRTTRIKEAAAADAAASAAVLGSSFPFPGAVMSGHPNDELQSTTTMTANGAVFRTIPIPEAGTLDNITMFIQEVSGNYDVGVASIDPDTLDHTMLWTKGSTAFDSELVPDFLVLGNPELDVSDYVGEVLALWFAASSATTRYYRFSGIGSGGSLLPEAFGQSRQWRGGKNSAFPLPTAGNDITLSSMLQGIAVSPWMAATLTPAA